MTDGEITTVWRKVAVAGDAGSTVRLASGTTYLKVALTLAAYRGTDTTNPVAVDHRGARAVERDLAHLAVGGQRHQRCLAGVVLVRQEQRHHVVDVARRGVDPGLDRAAAAVAASAACSPTPTRR